jgi:diketogulonate reductase-like aldo/keto reductase
VTKLPINAMEPEDVGQIVKNSLSVLCLDYIDLYLIHVPMGVEMDRDTGGLKTMNEKVRGFKMLFPPS